MHGIISVEFSNSQVMLRGCETPGYVIVSAAAASIVSCHHKPMWQQQQLKSKTSWVGSVECMQVGSTCLSIYCFYYTSRSFTHDRELSWTVLNGVNSNELVPNWCLYRLSVRTACT